MTEMPYGYLYQITNKVNGKTYIGIRKTGKDKYWREYMGSGKLIKQAISKYGQEQFIKTLVLYADTQEELVEREREAILLAKESDKAEYNITVYSPLMDKFHDSSLEKQLRWRKNLSEAIRRVTNDPKYVNARALEAQKRDLEFSQSYSVEYIKNMYIEHGSVEKIACILKYPRAVVYRFFKKNEIPQDSRTIAGYKRSEKERLNISNALRQRHGSDPVTEIRRCVDCEKKINMSNSGIRCSECESSAEGKIKGFTPDEVTSFTSQLKEPGISVREVSRRTGFSRSKTQRFMREFGYEIPPQSTTAAHEARRKKNAIKDKECPSCKKTFSPRRSDTKTCSVECGHELRRTQGSTRI